MADGKHFATGVICNVTGAGEGLSDITKHCKRERGERKLGALVYDILPPTTAMIDYVIGLGKLLAIRLMVFRWCSNGN